MTAFLNGGDLSKLIPPSGFSEYIAARFVVSITSATLYLHANGVVHGDIKPQNVFYEGDLDGAMHVVLGDFGFACFFDEFREKASLSGTPGYLAPEMLRMASSRLIEEVPKIDIFALGITVYCMVLGSNPA